MTQPPLSTSALAKALGKTTKQMFSELESLGWIERREEGWNLTAKGSFEGGNYRESQKFGRYIIWPATVREHQALLRPDDQLLNSTKLAKQLSLTRKMMDQVLSELGWVRPARKGWELSKPGQEAGGYQRENPDTAVPFVMWPAGMAEHPVLTRAVAERIESEELCCADGHQVACSQELDIDNWLYFSGLLHAYRKQLPFAENLRADFYLPQYHLYIEYIGVGNAPGLLSEKMRKKDLLLQSGYKYIELQDSDIEELDDVLPRQLLKYGIET